MKPKAATVADRSTLDYYDSQAINVARTITALEAWTIITEQTSPLMRLAFRIRDAISTVFGVRRIEGFSGARWDNVSVGDHLDFFLVENIQPDILVLTARDRHLDVMTCVTTSTDSVSITASVITKNIFGKFYMLPVGLAHRRIVRNSLRKLKQSLDGDPTRTRSAGG
ncbi:DUF2867 domain-containing protein [Mesorhizobium australafricanum]|uniref:DUF2867 domain-containing protein n=1 Tax=Mesorhizobium australafricanum TaxID=3072311 RepID=A0ABU4X1Z0_9HYPH|nr:DUF2867 domain-containing protein [Mesorhizobium sp. VK3E]MDX8441963.1 DUF2867 domain-containing protein [Mesorhizobium sp. VK3E]